MRALTITDAFGLAIEDAYFAARGLPRLSEFYAKSKRIRQRRGWIPWWEFRPHDAPKRVGYDRTRHR